MDEDGWTGEGSRDGTQPAGEGAADRGRSGQPPRTGSAPRPFGGPAPFGRPPQAQASPARRGTPDGTGHPQEGRRAATGRGEQEGQPTSSSGAGSPRGGRTASPGAGGAGPGNPGENPNVDFVGRPGGLAGGGLPRTAQPGHPWPRRAEGPNVDFVGRQATPGGTNPAVRRPIPFGGPGALPGTRQPAAPNELAATLAALDDMEGLGGAEPPIGLTPPDLTRMLDPVEMPAVRESRGPSGPSQASVETVRRAAKERLRGRAKEAGVDPAAGSQPSRVSASPSARAGTTVSQATLDQYLRRGQLLFERYRKELDIQAAAEEVSPVEYVNWALSLKPGLKSSTWRMYRQCLMHFLEGFPSHETARAIGLLEADAVDRSRPEAPPPPKGEKVDRRSSALKEKRFPAEDYERVVTYLRTFNRSRLAPVLADWLRAGILTGLRPAEWQATDLEVREDATAAYGRRAYLYVLSAKATNGRGTGVVRTLDLSAFTEPDLDVVRRMVGRAREWLEGRRYAETQGQCSGVLYSAVEKIWPRKRQHYTLYSCRHQAISNWKAILEPAEIAAIVGHGVTATASEHYGKKRSSWAVSQIPAPPRPVPEELAVVKDRIRLFERRLQLEVQAGLRKPNDIPEFPLG